MRISHRHRFIYFANPKTGSSSVRNMLTPHSDILSVHFRDVSPENPFYHHMPPLEAREIFMSRGWDFDSYYKFTFVRNPWARLVSTYAAKGRKGSKGWKARIARPLRRLLGYEPSFHAWLRTIKPHGEGAGERPDSRYLRYVTYSIKDYVSDSNGNILVDKIIRLEDIETEFPQVWKDLGLPTSELQLIKANEGRHRPYQAYYSKADIELVRAMYAYDITKYNYQFDNA